MDSDLSINYLISSKRFLRLNPSRFYSSISSPCNELFSTWSKRRARRQQFWR